jgi:hypothetical protein
VLTKYATAPTARDAALRLIEAYKAIRYKEDASELCAQVTQRYARDREVTSICSGIPKPVVARADSAPPPAPGKPPAF